MKICYDLPTRNVLGFLHGSDAEFYNQSQQRVVELRHIPSIPLLGLAAHLI